MGHKGQALVEFALSITIMLFLLSGIAEFGIAFFQFVQLRDAAQEGALYGSACNPCTIADIESRIRGSSDTPLNLQSPNVVISISAKDLSGNVRVSPLKCEADALEVRVSYSHKLFAPFMSTFLGRSDLPLNATVVDTVLTPYCP